MRWLALLILLSIPANAPGAGSEVLRVGTSGDYAPFSRDGEGFDIEVAGLLARDLGLRVEWVPFAWPDLSDRVAAGDFDVAMSGVTWRPRRAVVGRMTRALAAGGPCVIGAESPARVAVNRGGVLERWARGRFSDERVRAVASNLALPGLLATGEVDAIVTDSFELPHFVREGQPVRCEPRVDRKVYWVAPARVEDLFPRIEDWLRDHEAALGELRRRWLGGAAPRDEIDHLIDLLARRLAVMPHVAVAKRDTGGAVADPARERVVLEAVERLAQAGGLEPGGVREAFRLQIELAKSIQQRGPAQPGQALDLRTRLRPLISSLGQRIVASLARVAPLSRDDLEGERMAPLSAWLTPAEVSRLRRALLDVRPAH